MFEFYQIIPPLTLHYGLVYFPPLEYEKLTTTEILFDLIASDFQRYTKNFYTYIKSQYLDEEAGDKALGWLQSALVQDYKEIEIAFTVQNGKMFTRKEFFPSYPLLLF